MEPVVLRYGNTNTYCLSGENGGLLIDTDYAGTMPGFFKAIKSAGISVEDISYVIATHYHPDHMGIIGNLQNFGIRLVIVDVQQDYIHFPDDIFARERHLSYTPVDEKNAIRISCAGSREFLQGIGISGEIIHTPSHSNDSISVILDDGDCFVGDLEPVEYLAAYSGNPALQRDWDLLMSYNPKHIYYAHVNDKIVAAMRTKAWIIQKYLGAMDKTEELAFMMEEGAFIIQAHPYREAHYIDHIRLFPRSVHGAEVINCNQAWLSNEMAELYADKYDLLKTAGSDNHWGGDIFSRLKEKGFRPVIAGMCSDTELQSVQDYINCVRSGEMKIFMMNEDKEGHLWQK